MKKLFEVKWNVKSIVLIAMFMAITIVLSVLNEFLPQMPQGGTISIDIIAIFLCAYFMGAGYGVICGVGVAILQFVLGMATYYGPWSVLLDYVLPLAVCGIAPLIKLKKKEILSLITGITFSMILKYISHYLSGAWLFAEYAEGNPWIYSFWYNLYYNLGTWIVCLIVVPILYFRLKPVFEKLKR